MRDGGCGKDGGRDWKGSEEGIRTSEGKREEREFVRISGKRGKIGKMVLSSSSRGGEARRGEGTRCCLGCGLSFPCVITSGVRLKGYRDRF